MKKNKRIKIIVAVAICLVALIIGTIIYFANNDKYYFTSGIGKDELFKIDGKACTIGEFNIYLADIKSQYMKTFSDDIFASTIGEISFSEYLMDQTKQKVSSYKGVALFAEDKKISLNKEELAKVKEKAKAYMNGLSDEQKKAMKISIVDVENAFADHMLYEKVFAIYTAEVDTQVSVDEARVIKIQYIFVPNSKGKDFALECQSQIDSETNFAGLAMQYNEGGQYEYKLARGQMEKDFEDAAFELHVGEISDVITTKKGYYIIKCISDYEKNDTEINKLAVIEKRKETMFKEKYEAFVSKLPLEFNNKLWSSIDVTAIPVFDKTIDKILE